jgi:uncharacterized membrane protein (GlpM family)
MQKRSKLTWAALVIFPTLGVVAAVMAAMNRSIDDAATAAMCVGLTMVAYYSTRGSSSQISDKNF